MTCSLKLAIETDVKEAMRNKEKDKLTTLRLAMAAFKQKEVDERVILTDEQVLQILEKMIKQRRESIRQFEQGNRKDLAEKEQLEINILSTYLPQPFSSEALNLIIQEVITEVLQTGASGPQLMGQVMAKLKPKIQGRADMNQVSASVKTLLST